MRSLVGRHRSTIANTLGILLEQLGARLIHRFGAPLSPICHERAFYVAGSPCYPQAPEETRRAAMRELRSEEIDDRRVALVETGAERYSVTIAVRGPQGIWEDISLQSDQNLTLHTASLCERLRRTEQQTRSIDWHYHE
jgi:hypothetical protein